jgi:hypothetical protein
MTVDPGALSALLDGSALRDSWREDAAVRALDRAESAVGTALRRLAGADDVDWVGGPAARYRCELEAVVDRTRAAHARLVAAVVAAEQHAQAVRRLGAVTLVAPRPLGDRRPAWSGGEPWGEPAGVGGRPTTVPQDRSP